MHLLDFIEPTRKRVSFDTSSRPPTIILGPGEPEMAHKTDEYCRVDRLLEAVDLYRDILADWVAR